MYILYNIGFTTSFKKRKCHRITKVDKVENLFKKLKIDASQVISINFAMLSFSNITLL